MTKIAVTYMRIALAMPDGDREAFSEFVRANAIEISRRVYSVDTSVDVRIEEGSLRLWVAVAAALYAAVSSYGSFRSGIDYLVDDAREFSASIYGLVADTGVQSAEVQVFQRRLAVVGKIKRILLEIDQMDRTSYIDRNEKRQKYTKIKSLILDVLTEMTTPEDRELILSELPLPLKEEVVDESRLPLRKLPSVPHAILGRPEEWEKQAAETPTGYVIGYHGPGNADPDRPVDFERLVAFDPARGLLVAPTMGAMIRLEDGD